MAQSHPNIAYMDPLWSLSSRCYALFNMKVNKGHLKFYTFEYLKGANHIANQMQDDFTFVITTIDLTIFKTMTRKRYISFGF